MAARHHAEIAGFADCIGQRLQDRVTRRAQHRRRDDPEAELQKPGAGNETSLPRLALQQPFAFHATMRCAVGFGMPCSTLISLTPSGRRAVAKVWMMASALDVEGA